MRINKVNSKSSADLYFEIMSKYNSKNAEEKIVNFEKTAALHLGDLRKLASVVPAGPLKNLLRFNRGADEALDAVNIAQRQIDDLGTDLTRGRNTQGARANYLDLMSGTTKTARTRAWVSTCNSLEGSLKKMLAEANISKYMDDSYKLTDEAKALLKQDLRAAGTFTNPKVADEFVESVLEGTAFRSGSIGPAAAAEKAVLQSQRIADEAAAVAAAAARGTDEGADAAAAAARGTDELGAGARVTVSASDAAKAAKDGMRPVLDSISTKIDNIRAVLRSSTDSADIYRRTGKILDEIEVLVKQLKPPSLRSSADEMLGALRGTVRQQSEASQAIRAEINIAEGAIRAEGDVTIQQFINAAGPLSQTMLTHANKSIERLAGLKGTLTRYGDNVAAVKNADNSIQQSARNTANPSSSSNPVINNHVHVQTGPEYATKLIDDLGPALGGSIREQEDAFYLLWKAAKENPEDFIKQLKALRRAEPEKFDDYVRVSQNLDNIGNIKISGKLLKDLEAMGFKVPSSGFWSKAGTFTKWLVGAGVIAGAGYGAYRAYNYVTDDGEEAAAPDGSRPPPGGFPSESGSNHLGNLLNQIRDPEARAAAQAINPSSASYDPMRGHETFNQMLARLRASGNTKDYDALLNWAQNGVYKKRFRIKLGPTGFNTGGSVPILYAFVNQQMGGPNLADQTGDILATMTSLLNRGLGSNQGLGKFFRRQLSIKRGDAQMAINHVAEEAINKGLINEDHGFWDWFNLGDTIGEKRIKDLISGNELDSDYDQGIVGRRKQRLSDAAREEAARMYSNASNEPSDRLQLFADLSKKALSDNGDNEMTRIEKLSNLANNSINISKINDNQMLQKEADDFSESYYKDALKDLDNNDSTLRSYFAGLGGLYDHRLEKRKADFKELYNVTEETGEDLIYSAHPNEIVVSDAIGRGGLVENGLEQKRQSHGVALSAPTGNYRANYASRYDALKKMAESSFSS